jgi:hypothetical protein
MSIRELSRIGVFNCLWERFWGHVKVFEFEIITHILLYELMRLNAMKGRGVTKLHTTTREIDLLLCLFTQF